MQLEGFHHLAIQVRDLDRAEHFYADLLGLPVIARHVDGAGAPRAVWLGVGAGFIALERGAGPAGESAPEPQRWDDPAPGLFLLALRIGKNDRAAWERRLAGAGHPKVHETSYTFYVRDPEGNRVGLSHHPHE